MATRFFLSNSIVHSHFLSQKTCAANPVFRHGIVKLPKPLPITRTRVRAFNSPGDEWIDQPSFRLNNGEIDHADERGLLDLLGSPAFSLKYIMTHLPPILKHIEAEGRLHRLCDILERRHISKLWTVASPYAMVFPDHEKWCGRSWKINRGVPRSYLKRVFRRDQQLPMKGRWKMEILDCYDSYDYGVFSRGNSEYLFIVEKNPICIRHSVKPCDLAFDFGGGKRLVRQHHQSFIQQAKQRESLNDSLTVYIRSAAPNVLVGQIWKPDTKEDTVTKNPRGLLLLVKDCKYK